VSDSKYAKDIVDAVKHSDVYEHAVSKLSESDRAGVEATVEGFAAILGPLIGTLDGLEQSEEVKAAVRARLAEKMRTGS
jgi:hypothetical protein